MASTRGGQYDVAQSGRAVADRGAERPCQGPRRADMDRHVASQEIDEIERVPAGLIDLDIAADRSDADQIDRIGAQRRRGDANGIVGTGVDIHDQGNPGWLRHAANNLSRVAI
jgi:hypothetical protein